MVLTAVLFLSGFLVTYRCGLNQARRNRVDEGAAVSPRGAVCSGETDPGTALLYPMVVELRRASRINKEINGAKTNLQ